MRVNKFYCYILKKDGKIIEDFLSFCFIKFNILYHTKTKESPKDNSTPHKEVFPTKK